MKLTSVHTPTGAIHVRQHTSTKYAQMYPLFKYLFNSKTFRRNRIPSRYIYLLFQKSDGNQFRTKLHFQNRIMTWVYLALLYFYRRDFHSHTRQLIFINQFLCKRKRVKENGRRALSFNCIKTRFIKYL